jgi:hypothetical protein
MGDDAAVSPALPKEARHVRTMAILCAMIGPLMLILTLAMLGAAEAIDWAVDRHLIAEQLIRPELSRWLRFFELSSAIMIPLSVATLVIAIRALKHLGRGRHALWLLGWAWVGGMIVLSALWEGIAFGDNCALSDHLYGVSMHLIQAALIARACFYLARADVKAACDGIPGAE